MLDSIISVANYGVLVQARIIWHAIQQAEVNHRYSFTRFLERFSPRAYFS